MPPDREPVNELTQGWKDTSEKRRTRIKNDVEGVEDKKSICNQGKMKKTRSKKSVDTGEELGYNAQVPERQTTSDGVWRSLVAYVLWEHGVGGSNPFTPTIFRFMWPRGQEVKTPPFHGDNRGSIPLGVTIFSGSSGAFSSVVRAGGS